MPLPRNPQQLKTCTPGFDAAHYVSLHIPILFSDNEGFWKAVVQIHEKGGGVVFWKTHTVYVNHLLQIRGFKSPQCERCLQSYPSLPVYCAVLTTGNVMFPRGIAQTFAFLPARSKASRKASFKALAVLNLKVLKA